MPEHQSLEPQRNRGQEVLKDLREDGRDALPVTEYGYCYEEDMKEL